MDGQKAQLARGRGGRGTLLLAALQNEPRRPGDSGTSSSLPHVEEQNIQPTIGRGGRGALLLAALQGEHRRPGESAGTPAPLLQPPPITESSKYDAKPTTTIGRGAILKQLLLTHKTAPPEEKEQVLGPKSVSPPCKPEGTVELPIQEISKMSLKDHHGTSGQTLPMEVNYVRLKTSSSYGISEYHVSFNPPVDSRNMRFKLMSQPQVKEATGLIKNFDSAKLYLPKRLEDVVNVEAKMPTDNSSVNICIKYIKKAADCDVIHMYNVLLRKIMAVLKMTQIGRNYFDPKGGIPVPQHHLEVWPGYVTAVHEFEGGIMLNCDASFRVLRTVTAKDIIVQCAQNMDRMDDNIAKNLIGSIVLTRYNNKTYKVDDFARDMSPMSTFTTHDGKELSFKDYYKNCYDIVIKDLNQPLLINKPKKRAPDEPDKLICLVPELCYMTGLTDSMRNDFKVMKDIAAHTRVTPERRQFAMQNFIKNIKQSPEAKKILDDWNLEFENAAVHVEGRTVDMEKIFFRDGRMCMSGPKANWSNDATRNRVLLAVNLENWFIVCTENDYSKALDFAKMMKTVSPAMGIEVSEPSIRKIRNDRTETFCNELRNYVNPRVQLAVIIFPTARDDRYSAIKKLCCVDLPIPSQVINAKTLRDFKKLRSVTQKIALQINCKLGGELWSLAIPLESIMVCGMDSYHDSTNKKNSVLGFVASINRNLTRWFSMTNIQKPGQELGDCLKMLFISALRKYHQVNHSLPKKIFLFRDGVGDGMLSTVSKYEVPQLISCFSHMEVDYEPSLTVIVVQKRINTRLFAKAGRSLDNPPPGSVLDHTVTRKGLYDFFLVSQHVGQGTVAPSHYVVSYDSSTLKPDHLQKLTYKMTHLYYNWPGTIRVPAPCQYAHKLAFLVGQSIHKETSSELADKLFYL